MVSLAVYSYFLAALMGAQWVDPKNSADYAATYHLPVFLGSNDTDSGSTNDHGYQNLDLHFPFFLSLQFAFYVGWLKVAETLINPFGEDDDDFELNRLIDRHLQVGYLTCDPTVEKPELLKDKFWNEIIPSDMPYTVGAQPYKAQEFKGSAEMTLDVKEEDKIYSGSNYYAGVTVVGKLNV